MHSTHSGLWSVSQRTRIQSMHCKQAGKKAKHLPRYGANLKRKTLFTPLDVGLLGRLSGIAGLVHRKGLGGWLVLSGLLVNKAWADDERQPPVPVVTYVIFFFSVPLSGLALALPGCLWGAMTWGGFLWKRLFGSQTFARPCNPSSSAPPSRASATPPSPSPSKRSAGPELESC